MGIGLNYVTDHALARIRERWPAASRAPQTRILETVASSIKQAQSRGEMVRVPGGTYVPFSFRGDEGFLVLKKKSVITAVGADWCPEVVSYLEKKRNGQV